MPLESTWYIEDHVVYIRQWGDLTLQDLIDTDQEVAYYAQSIPGQIIHAIIDARAVDTAYISSRDVRQTFLNRAKSTQGYLITLLGTHMSALLMQVLVQSQNMRHRDVDSIAEALDFLQYVDDSLANLPVNDLVK